MIIKPKEVKSKKLILTLEIELTNSCLDEQEAADRISYAINTSSRHEISEFIVFLLRETKSSYWELKKLEINKIE